MQSAENYEKNDRQIRYTIIANLTYFQTYLSLYNSGLGSGITGGVLGSISFRFLRKFKDVREVDSRTTM